MMVKDMNNIVMKQYLPKLGALAAALVVVPVLAMVVGLVVFPIDFVLKMIGRAGAGGQRMTMEKFMLTFGVKMEVINFRSAGDATTALMGGQVDMQLNNVSTLAPAAKNGTVRILAVAGDSRLKAVPQVPTTREAGFPDYTDKGYVGLYARAGTPPEIVNFLAAEIGKLTVKPDMKERFSRVGLDLVASSNPAEFSAFIVREIALGHGAIITLADGAGGKGTRIVLEFPLHAGPTA